MLNFLEVTADHPQSVNDGRSRSSNFESIGFIVSNIFLFLCCEILA